MKYSQADDAVYSQIENEKLIYSEVESKSTSPQVTHIVSLSCRVYV